MAVTSSASSVSRIAMGGTRRPGILVVFDLDDTLVVTQPRFDAANAVILPLIAGEAGVDPTVVRARYLEIRKGKDARGFSTAHYAQAYIEAYRGLVKVRKPSTENRIASVAAAVWTPPYQMHAGAAQAVSQIARHPAVGGVVILTLGNRAVQAAKINSMPAMTRAAIAGAYVVGAKNAAIFRTVLGTTNPTRAIMIGNSRASDIAPAQACHMAAILVEAGGWERDQATVNVASPFFRRVSSISGAPAAATSLIAAMTQR